MTNPANRVCVGGVCIRMFTLGLSRLPNKKRRTYPPCYRRSSECACCLKLSSSVCTIIPVACSSLLYLVCRTILDERYATLGARRCQFFSMCLKIYLSGMHHNQRGLPKGRYKVWIVLHNFDCHASDGTTPAARFFRRGVPDLFETVLSKIDVYLGLGNEIRP